MMQAIGAMHAALRAKKRPDDDISHRDKLKKRRREQREGDDVDRERPAPAERGHKA